MEVSRAPWARRQAKLSALPRLRRRPVYEGLIVLFSRTNIIMRPGKGRLDDGIHFSGVPTLNYAPAKAGWVVIIVIIVFVFLGI